MKKKNIFLLSSIAIALIIVGVIVVIALGSSNKGDDKSQESEQTGISNESTIPTDVLESTEINIETNEQNLEDDATGEESGGNSTRNNSGSSSNSNNSVKSGINFPYTDSAKGITLDVIFEYSGSFIEDGLDEPVDSVAMLQVTNSSGQDIEYAEINLTSNGQQMVFSVSLLPAGETALVMEKNKISGTENDAYSYDGATVAFLSELEMHEDRVSVVAGENGDITISNVGNADIPELRIFYKNQLDTGEYIGGIAYTVRLENLSSGDSITVSPSHFDSEYGKVMMIRIYD